MVSVEASELTWPTNNERMAVRTKVVEKMRGILVFTIEEAIVESIANVKLASKGSAKRQFSKNLSCLLDALHSYMFISVRSLGPRCMVLHVRARAAELNKSI